LSDDFAKQAESQLETARDELIDATQAQIEAEARLKAAKVAVTKWENVLKALSNTTPTPAEPPRAEPAPEKGRPLEDRSPEDGDTPAPANSGPQCKSCGGFGTTRLITKRINGKPIRFVFCQKCRSESPA